jgi:hypothetical protein
MGERLNLSDPAQGRVLTTRLAACVLGRQPGAAMRFAATYPSGPEGRRALDALQLDDCLAAGKFRELMITPALLRGAMHHALYQRDFSRAGPPPAPLGPTDFAADLPPGASDPQYLLLRAMARCVVETAPDRAHGALIAAVGTADDDAAFRAIVPEIGPCLPQGIEAKLSRQVTMGLLAEAAWRGRGGAALNAAR